MRNAPFLGRKRHFYLYNVVNYKESAGVSSCLLPVSGIIDFVSQLWARFSDDGKDTSYGLLEESVGVHPSGIVVIHAVGKKIYEQHHPVRSYELTASCARSVEHECVAVCCLPEILLGELIARVVSSVACEG